VLIGTHAIILPARTSLPAVVADQAMVRERCTVGPDKHERVLPAPDRSPPEIGGSRFSRV
jgi:hypothetical protein